MPDIFRVGGSRDNREYELALNWDDAAFVDGKVAFEIQARSRVPGEDWRGVNAQVSLEPSDGQAVLIVALEGKELLRFPMAELAIVEQVMEKIPAWVFTMGDPITGCLLRAGLSVTIGQTITCKNTTEEHNWFWDRSRAMGVCLREHLPSMGATAAWRVARCIFRAGF